MIRLLMNTQDFNFLMDKFTPKKVFYSAFVPSVTGWRLFGLISWISFKIT